MTTTSAAASAGTVILAHVGGEPQRGRAVVEAAKVAVAAV